MRTGVITQKVGMTRLFLADGRHVPVTVLKLDGCQVLSQRTDEKDGYTAIQLGSGFAKAKRMRSRRTSYPHAPAPAPQEVSTTDPRSHSPALE